VGFDPRQGGLEGLLPGGLQEQLGRGLARMALPLVAALHRAQPVFRQGGQGLGQDADGVAAAGVDVDARVAALEPETLIR